MAERPPQVKNVPRNLKPYFLGLLEKGPRWNETDGSETLLPQQLAFLRAQIESRKYLVAGPVMDEDRYAGMMIIAAPNLMEARRIASEDPGVKTGRLTVELHPVFLPSLDSLKVEY